MIVLEMVENDNYFEDIPEGVLPAIKEELRQKIFDAPDEAWDFIITNSVAVIAISSLREELQDNLKENSLPSDKISNIELFLEEYEDHYQLLFSVDPLVDKLGLAFTTELIAEFWRRNNQEDRIPNPR